MRYKGSYIDQFINEGKWRDNSYPVPGTERIRKLLHDARKEGGNL